LRLKTLFFLIFTIIINGCLKEEPNLPEVKLVEEQEFNLWKAEAFLYLPKEFAIYKEEIKKAKNHLSEERAKFFWFRDYNSVQKEFQNILKQGDEISKALEIEIERRALLILQRINSLEERVNYSDIPIRSFWEFKKRAL
jgi:hypothetical protein